MLRQLILKELRIQLSGIYFALAIVLIAAILAGLATQADWTVNLNTLSLSAIIGVLYSVFVIPAMAYVVPLFFGAAMIAEERRVGMLDWQLAVPLPRLWQVLIKLLVGAALVFTVTFILQPLMYKMMAMVVPSGRLEFWLPKHLLWVNMVNFPIAVFLMMCGAYASSMLSDSYKAFWLGIVLSAIFLYVPGAIIINFVSQAFYYWRYSYSPGFITRYWDGSYLTAVYLLVLAQLAYNINYHYRYESMRWSRIAIDVVGSLLIIIVIMLFFAAALFIHINTRIY